MSRGSRGRSSWETWIRSIGRVWRSSGARVRARVDTHQMMPRGEHLDLERGRRERREAHQRQVRRCQDGVNQEHPSAQRQKRCQMTTLSARSATVVKVPPIRTSSLHQTSWWHQHAANFSIRVKISQQPSIKSWIWVIYTLTKAKNTTIRLCGSQVQSQIMKSASKKYWQSRVWIKVN